MKQYKVVKNQVNTYKSTGGLDIHKEPNIEAEYTILDNGTKIINFPRYNSSSKKLAYAICKKLNKGKIKI